MSLVNQTRTDAVPSWSLLVEEYTITSGMSLTFSHGFNDKPYNVSMRLKCKTAELGYAVGDEVNLGVATSTGIASGASIATNHTQIKVKLLALPFIQNFTTGAPTAITAANWNLVIIIAGAP